MASHVNHASFSHRRSSYRPCHSLQTSAKSEAVMGAVQTNTSYFGTSIVRTAFFLSLFLPSFLPSFLPYPPASSRPHSTATRKRMSTYYQGASGPSGHAGLQPAPGQPVNGNHAIPGPVLTRLEQPSQERLTSNQIRKLTVRPLIERFNLRVKH